jgi:hypothetical protein
MVIDEAGMLGSRDLARLLKAADEAHTKTRRRLAVGA